MREEWVVIINILWVCVFLIIASIIKGKNKLFRRIIIPTSIIAGFIGLILGEEIIGFVNYDTNVLKNLVYHALGIGFITLTLRDNKEEDKNQGVFNTGLFIVSIYLIQGIVGFMLTLYVLDIFIPDLFPTIGLLLPLAFGQGVGFAYSIGSSWEDVGLLYGGNLGLTLATIGLLVGYIVGTFILNYYVRKKRIIPIEEDEVTENNIRISTKYLVIDEFTLQVSIIGAIYFLSYGTLIILDSLLSSLGELGATLAGSFWGLQFLFGICYAILFKAILNHLQANGFFNDFQLNNFLFEKISNAVFEFMICAAIMSISLQTISTYWLALTILTLSGVSITMLAIHFFAKHLYPHYRYEYALGMFGMMTGNSSTAIGLLKEIDPNLRTPVAKNLALGSSVAFPFGIPLFIILNLPIAGYVQDKPSYYTYTLLLLTGYLLLLITILYFKNRKRKA